MMRRLMARWIAAFAGSAALLLVAVCSAGAGPIHVTPGGTDPAGASWATPTSLTNALAICTAADELWLAEGTYTNAATFTVGADRTLYGGFTNGMATRDERDWNAHPTILNGQSQNVRVVTVTGTNVTLDGLVISNSVGSAAGGIAKAVTGALTLANCRLVNHASATHGVGGSFTAGTVLMTNCLVANNTETTYYTYGFGIYSSGANLDLVDCVVSNNSSASFRGSVGLGLCFDKGTLRAWRTHFINNTGPANGAGPGSKQGGAGVYLGSTAGTSATFSNCVFRGNESKWCGSGMPGYGGALFVNLAAAATARVVNCTFTGNAASYGYGGAIALSSGTLILKNSILWTNTVGTSYTGSEIYRYGGTLDISYCDLTGLGFPHVDGATLPLSCRARDPLFASSTDLHLQSSAGRWDPGLGDFVTTDGSNSPCIDGGDPADPIGEEPTDNGNARINMGCYGGTAQASKSPPAAAPLLEDLGYNVYYHRAEITGELTNETFVSAHVYLCYGTNTVAGDATNGWGAVMYLGEKQSGAEFSTWTPALLPETMYFYRWYAVNGEGSNWTAAASFETGTVPPGGGTNVIHVDRLATGAGDGIDWAHAYPSFVKALQAIGGTRTNVWITGDTYGEGMVAVVSGSATLVGGFAGTEATAAERTLTNALGMVTNYTAINGEAFHQCLSITAGNVSMESLVLTNSASAFSGGGIYKAGTGTLTMVNCRLVGNVGSGAGVGGAFTAGSVVMSRCLVANNTENTWYVHGFGIYSSGANLDLVDCVISNNSCASYRGSYGLGLYFNSGKLRALRTDFVDNKGPANAGCGGAGVYLGNTAGTSATFSNCVFRGNEAYFYSSASPGYGGALWVNLAAASTARVVNCTFTANVNSNGNGGAIYLGNGTLILKNSILWSNEVGSGYSGTEIYKAAGTLEMSYCDLTGLEPPQVVGATPPASCQAFDPLFASATDLHLQSPAGRWDPNAGGFVTTDAEYSHGIDTGDPADPIGDEPTDNGNVRINMGRYGGTAEASKSPPVVPPLPADRGTTVNYDHVRISGELTNATYVSAQVTLCYGTSSIPGDATNGWGTVKEMGEQQNGVVFSTWTPTLLPETTYHYRWYAANDEGSNWTEAASFMTGTTAPGGGMNVIHVDRLATGAGDGDNWANAFTKIGDAFAAVGGTRTNVWITGDTYGEGGVVTLSRSATVIGGFVGTETAASGRTRTNAVGVMTNYTVINGQGAHPCLSITASNASIESVVFTNGATALPGCGIAKTVGGALTLVNCRLVNNAGSGQGVGGYFSGGSVLMSNCVVAKNTETAYYVHGFGVHSSGANLDLVDCVFSNNSSASFRGSMGLGLYFNNGRLRAWRTDFIDNTGPATTAGVGSIPTEGGAGVCLGNSVNTSAIFSNCVFRGNVAKFCGTGNPGIGGAMWLNLAAAATARVVNCTFKDNANLYGNGGAIAISGGTLILKNSIFWTNTVASGYTGREIFATNASSRVTNSYCCFAGTNAPHVVAGGSAVVQWGSGIMVGDPLYVSSTDVHLQSKGGHWDSAAGAWVNDAVTSPCLDAGDPDDPVGQEPRPNGNVINMGAYGGTTQASRLWKSGTIFVVH